MRSLFNRFPCLGTMHPSTELPAGTTDIKDAIMRGDTSTVQRMLDKANLSPETWQPLLEHAFKKESSSGIKRTFGFERGNNSAIKAALLEHPVRDSQFALELAIHHNDIRTARKALKCGADPERTAARIDANDMRALLVLARRRNLLYPSHISHAHETDLDRALRNMLDDSAKKKACTLLQRAIQGKKYQEAWRDAVKENRLDIQRAILLLHADQDRNFRLLQEDPVTDPGVIKVMKEIPYFSPKRRLPKNFNSEARFLGKNKEINCIHLVEHRQAVQERSSQLKFDDVQYASEVAIAAHVSYDTEAKHLHLRAHAAETHLLHNRDFGKTLVQQFDAMTRKNETARLILLTSTDHAMSVGLKIKKEDGKPHYVAEMFDPNRTTSHVRLASDSLHAFETQTLKSFIDTESTYKNYYPEPDGLSMMFIRPSPQENPASGAVENRALTSCIEDKKINAIAIWHMLAHGFAGDLRRLKNEITNRSVKEQIRLLAAKDANGNPGLFMALQDGHAEAIKAFGELLELLPPEKRSKLLAATNAKREHGLSMALQYGHAEAIKAFGELLKQVPPKERAKLLATKSANGIHGLVKALANGHTEAITAFGELLTLVSPQERIKLLEEIRANTNSIHAFDVARTNGHNDAIKAFVELF